MSHNIYLTGFMGSGKSSVGKALAARLGRRFVDLDQRIEKRVRMPIAEVFATKGEAAFRKIEAGELAKVARRSSLVIATGGGLPMAPANRKLMRASGLILHLAASLEFCRANVKKTGGMAQRPLWQDRAALQKLFAQRQSAYKDCAIKLDCDGLGVAECALAAARALIPEQRGAATLGQKKSPLISTYDGPAALGEFLGSGKAALLTDRNVGKLHLERYQDALGGPPVITMPPGEGSKTLRGAAKVYEALTRARMERGDLLIALGGGVITDLGGFVAATYKRGMPFALVSTSLLGCVDAAVGGKSGVNLGSHKNQVGCFTQPRVVVLDLMALGTLPRRQRTEGLVEAYKTGLVYEPKLARLVEENQAGIMGGDLMLLAQVARLSARAKAQVVAQDFREAGLRRILNLGHTYGHALEGASKFRVSHGRSVAAGIMVAAMISRRRGLIDDDLCGRIIQTMRPLAPAFDKWPGVDAAWPLMQNDKKNQAGRVMFVLLEAVGRPIWVEDVNPQELGAVLEEVMGS